MCVVDYTVSTFSSNYIKNDLEPSLLSLRAFFCSLSLQSSATPQDCASMPTFWFFQGMMVTLKHLKLCIPSSWPGSRVWSASLLSVDQALMFGTILLWFPGQPVYWHSLSLQHHWEMVRSHMECCVWNSGTESYFQGEEECESFL